MNWLFSVCALTALLAVGRGLARQKTATPARPRAPLGPLYQQLMGDPIDRAWTGTPLPLPALRQREIKRHG